MSPTNEPATTKAQVDDQTLTSAASTGTVLAYDSLGPATERQKDLSIIRDIPKYSGDDINISIEQWLQVINETAAYAGLEPTDLLRALPLKLEGTAADYFRLIKNELQGSSPQELWNTAQRRLEERFKLRRDSSSYMMQLAALSQGEKQAVQAFAQQVKAVGAKAHPELVPTPDLLDTVLMKHFVRGLRPHLTRILRSRHPQTFQEAVDIATEEAQFDIDGRLGAVGYVGHPEGLQDLVAAVVKQLQPPAPTSNENVPPVASVTASRPKSFPDTPPPWLQPILQLVEQSVQSGQNGESQAQNVSQNSRYQENQAQRGRASRRSSNPSGARAPRETGAARTRKCYLCQQVGHLLAACPSLAQFQTWMGMVGAAPMSLPQIENQPHPRQDPN